MLTGMGVSPVIRGRCARLMQRFPLGSGMSADAASGTKFVRISERLVTALGPVDGERVGSNSTIVLGEAATLVVDTMISPALMQPVKLEAERLGGRPVRYVYNTHGDPDHLLVNGLFGGAEVIAQRRVTELLAEPERRKNYEQLLEGTGVPLKDPTITFNDRLDVNLGGLTVRAKYVGPAHSAADTVAWLPEERAFFSGDTVFNGLFPLVRDVVGNWLAALAYGVALEPAVVIPGHGPVGDANLLTWQRSVLERIHGAVLELRDSGTPLERAAESPVPEGLRLPLAGARWPAAVRAIYAMSGTAGPAPDR